MAEHKRRSSGAPADPQGQALAQAYRGNDCQVLVHIIEARDLKGRDSSGQSDPVVVVTALDQKQSTKIIKKTTSCVWDHLMTFQFKMEAAQFERGSVKVEVFDANTFARNVLIGTHTFDVARVYSEPAHELHRRWAALADLTDKHEGVQGYLKLSVVCLKPGDVPKVHSAAEEDEEEGGESLEQIQDMVLRPPSIAAEDYEFVLDVFSAVSLPVMDINGKCDPYVELRFAGLAIRTEVRQKTLDADWNERLCVPVTVPTMSDTVEVRVIDKDAVGSDELIATLFFSFAEVREKPVSPSWMHLYGPLKQGEGKKELEEAMLRGAVPGTAYRGSVLLAARAEKVKEGKLHKTSAGQPVGAPQQIQFSLRVDAFEICNLPENNDVWLELSLGSKMVTSKKATVRRGRGVFNEAVQELLANAPQSAIPDIFINVMRSHQLRAQRLAFLRLPTSSLKVQGTDPEWFQLNPDVFTIGEDKDAGFLLLRVNFGQSSELKAVPRQKIAPLLTRQYRLRANIYQARDLPAADLTGLSDPYLSVTMANKKVKTRIEEQTLFPAWYQSFELDVELPVDLRLAPALALVVKDADTFGPAEMLGRCYVQAQTLTPEAKAPTWVPVWDPTPEYPCGEVLCSFQLFPIEDAAKFPSQQIAPRMTDVTVEAAVLHLERLLPAHLLPARAPYLELSVGSGKTAVQAITGSARGMPGNKTFPILEKVQMQVSAPEDCLFAPPLNIVVKDNRPGIDPVLGTLSLSLSSFYKLGPPRPVLQEVHGAAEEPTVDLGEVEAMKEPSAGLAEERAKQAGAEKAQDAQKEQGAAVLAQDDRPQTPEANSSESAILVQTQQSAGPSDVELASIQERRTLPDVEESQMEGVGAEVGEPGEQDEEKKRQHVERELETMFKLPYKEWALSRGKKRKGRKGLRKQPASAGILAGDIRVIGKNSPAAPFLDLEPFRAEKRVVVRLYILRGRVVPKDPNGLCDPYICIKNGPASSFKVRDDKNYKAATLQPEYYAFYEVPCTLPAQNEITVSVWDWDRLGGDDFVGLTKIDVARRYLSDGWKALGPLKPIENRTLWNPTSSTPQGHLEMWVDIMTEEEAARTPPTQIGPPPVLEFELRVCVWNTKDVKFRDKDMSDIFVVGYIDPKNQQRTDVHWRSKDGKGMFNWRFVFPLTFPSKTGPYLTMQIWDKDVLNPDDVIAEARVNLRALVKRVYKEGSSASLPKQWITLVHPNYDGPQGRIEVTMDLLTQSDAAHDPAGKGRDPPNALAEPNRPKTSFAFWRLDRLFTQVIWKKMRCCFIITIAIVLIVIVGGIAAWIFL